METGYSTYLLTWNPTKFPWDNFESTWEGIYSGNSPLIEWSCGNTKRINVGDRIFMMRLGFRQAITGIFCSGWVTGEPREGIHWGEDSFESVTQYVEFEPDVLLHPQFQTLLNPMEFDTEFNWRPQRSGVTIPAEVASKLEKYWDEHLQQIHTPFYSASSNMSETDLAETSLQFSEGKRVLSSVYRYERNPRARKACIATYGTSCFVCGFDFGKVYGDIGIGFIHVHHLTPVSSYESESATDPVRDMRPVCPNCHAMIHRRNPPYSLEELKDCLHGARITPQDES